jgi:uncharacterized protein (TIGR00297 family)
MRLIEEYRKQIIFILLGFLVFLFPLFKTSYYPLALVFLIAGILLLIIPTGSAFFNYLARESDAKAGKLITMIQLFLTTAVLLLISSMMGAEKFPLFIIGSAFAITTFGDGIADMINILEKDRKQTADHKLANSKVYSAKSSMLFLISGSFFAFISGVWISGFTLVVPMGVIIFLSVIGALTGALLESMTRNEDNIIIPFGSAMAMWLFYMFGFNVDPVFLLKVLAFSFFLGYLSYRVRIADISAMLSATLMGVVIIISSDIKWFYILLAFFMLGSIFTRYKYNFKLAHGTAEGKHGTRGYKNVFSNSLAALVLAMAYGIFHSHAAVLMAAYLGSVATACGDTLASEIGQTFKGEPRMITTLKKAKRGTDGAVSWLGEGAALFGSLAIAVLAYVLIKEDMILLLVVTAGGFIGTNIDSAFGATLQQKGYLSNNGVNLFATVLGAIVTGLIYGVIL